MEISYYTQKNWIILNPKELPSKVCEKLEQKYQPDNSDGYYYFLKQDVKHLIDIISE